MMMLTAGFPNQRCHSVNHKSLSADFEACYFLPGSLVPTSDEAKLRDKYWVGIEIIFLVQSGGRSECPAACVNVCIRIEEFGFAELTVPRSGPYAEILIAVGHFASTLVVGNHSQRTSVGLPPQNVLENNWTLELVTCRSNASHRSQKEAVQRKVQTDS